jgi:hypothetical protein
MALITAAELKGSREARKAKVDTVPDGDVTQAIADAERELYGILGYKIETSQTTVRVRVSGGEVQYLPERARTITSVTVAGTTDTDRYPVAGGFALKREFGRWIDGEMVITGTFGYTATDDKWQLAKRAVKLMAIHALASSEPQQFPHIPGAYLTSWSTEGTSFTFFTPEGKFTGDPEVDKLVKLIGIHPNKRGVKSVVISPAGRL